MWRGWPLPDPLLQKYIIYSTFEARYIKPGQPRQPSPAQPQKYEIGISFFDFICIFDNKRRGGTLPLQARTAGAATAAAAAAAEAAEAAKAAAAAEAAAGAAARASARAAAAAAGGTGEAAVGAAAAIACVLFSFLLS